ncbi:hypothetical protein [Bradyrhizobium sp. RD5-C2]|uniref:hypothetical protein n=1 Tax=Bradyrhizobium sp. RD5-C2 TaxID=244562 RepID=UPI001CC5C7C2|nr:hypothetical protein [Bradyrhizobium sp. RD5-C2]GIQ75942.1 hypothetical protein BraRD5C2_43850 [Bradyrhizobium sp. RD5-C2]
MSDDPISSALERIQQHDAQAAFHAAESVRWKTVVNALDELAQRAPRFTDLSPTTTPGAAVAQTARISTKAWAAGEFLGVPFATAAKAIFQARFDAAGKASPAPVEDIREALLQGTYNFGTSNADVQKQGIRISLGKNSALFVKLPNTDLFGLLEWYPGLRKPTPKARVAKPQDEKEPTSDPYFTASEDAIVAEDDKAKGL